MFLQTPSFLGWGLFLFTIFLPVSNVFSNLVQGNGQGCVFFMIQAPCFPRDLHEEFKKIQFCRCPHDERVFLVGSGISGQEDEIDQVSEERIDLGTQ